MQKSSTIFKCEFPDAFIEGRRNVSGNVSTTDAIDMAVQGLFSSECRV
jgi:hypothetical protein